MTRASHRESAVIDPFLGEGILDNPTWQTWCLQEVVEYLLLDHHGGGEQQGSIPDGTP